MDRAG